MTYDEIVSQLCEALENHPKVDGLMNETSPENYGPVDLPEFNINGDSLRINVGNRTIKFWDADFQVTVLKEESGDDGIPVRVRKKVSGEGVFDFYDNNTKVKISHLDLEAEISEI
ncbi:hypothetical protein [Flavobacterium sp.]|uniref:hypothetical protein n=1 Tax=Flavobacterium sp. TaxID=239 RepID=UPI0026191403|nr:hypothetical protein [Flavobacterium sp.]